MKPISKNHFNGTFLKHPFRSVPTVLASLGNHISPMNAALLIFTPIGINWFLIMMFMPDRIKKLPDKITHLTANIWHVLPMRLEDGQNQMYKNKEHGLHLILVGLIMTGAVTATACLMTGQKVLTPKLSSQLANQTSLTPIFELLGDCVQDECFLPISPAAQEFLIVGGLPALLCHLVSCLLLVMYYRCSHTWRKVSGGRDLNCCCCVTIGRLCSQKNPVVGEIPFWEQVGG